ncbi:hypothetical protein GC197_02290 [bacterium]|nr:hypothetical protein [bacterium]
MNQLLAPESPFNQEQRKFVEGFLTALHSVRKAHSAQQSQTDAPGAPLTILYGSQSGNSEALSKDLRKAARNRGFGPDVMALDSFDFESVGEIQHLLIICSTFGEGDPPDNAKKFTDWLMSDEAPQLPNLSYSVCAMGDQSYTYFCKAGVDIDNRLSELGAQRLADCVLCDVDYDDDFAAWKEAVFEHPSMIEAAEEGGAPIGADEEEPEGAAPGNWSKVNPFPATLLRVQRLSGDDSAKEVNHIEISLAGSGLEYEVGDALGVWPVNCHESVEAILQAGNFTGEEVVDFKGEARPLRCALLRKVDLQVLTPAVRQKMDLPCEDDWLRDRHLIDVLVNFAPQVSAQTLVDSLRPLQPRLYSIASSPKAHPGQVHLTVGAVRYEMHGRICKGVASTYLADRLHPGGSVGVYLQKSAHFRLPEDPSVPIIMVGPGTGIAPFRAFLEERIAVGATGKSWIFFGDQHQASDYLYRGWLEQSVSDGVLSRLDLAWSRDSADKVYVQHKMLDAGAELFDWLEAGAHFYICGDASRMASDVDRALRQIIAERSGGSADDANAYVDRLIQEHRYQRDVY